MSKSYHVTLKDFRGKTKKEIAEMEKDPDSILVQWAEKRKVKKAIKKRRKQNTSVMD